MPTISVIIPAYNAEYTILETIVSVQKQTFSDFEIIVIDDGSKDRTLELLHSITDKRVKIFSYNNGGSSVARNRGISHATGEFIAFLDSDDLWTPDKLELQLAALQQHTEAGVAYSWIYFMDEKGESFSAGNTVHFEGNVLADLLLTNFLENGSNPLIRRKAIEDVGGFAPDLIPCEDWDFYLRIAPHWSFVVVPKLQIFYRQTSGSLSSKVELMEKASLIVLERAFQSAPQELQSLKNQSLVNLYHHLAQEYLIHGTNIRGINQAGKKLWLAICLHPQTLLNKKVQKLIKWFIKKWMLIRLLPQSC